MIIDEARWAWSPWVLVSVLAGATAFAAPAPKPGEGFQTAAPNAILMEADGGGVLFEKNADVLIPPAASPR